MVNSTTRIPERCSGSINKTLETAIGILDASGEGKLAYELRELFNKQLKAINDAHTSLAMVGFPEINGKYHKEGEWNFTKMAENGNPEDARCVKKAFLILDEHLI